MLGKDRLIVNIWVSDRKKRNLEYAFNWVNDHLCAIEV